MVRRWGLGPVFAYEWLAASRRWQVYAARSLFVAALLVGLALVWKNHVAGLGFAAINQLARVGKAFYEAIVGIQLALVLLAAPAATAGAICLDKARGTLAHLLMTDLSDAEIVLGKLAARLVPVLGLVACALPVMLLGTLLGGIDPEALIGATLVSVGLAVLGCTLALAASVWGTKTHEVLLGTYLVWAIWLLASPTLEMLSWSMGLGVSSPDWLDNANPFLLCFATYGRPGSVGLASYATFFVVTLLISAALTTIAVLRVRAVAARQASRPARAGRRWGRVPGWGRLNRHLPGPSLDGNPVLWREWHRARPSRWSQIIWGLYAVLAASFSLLVVSQALGGGIAAAETAAFTNGFQVSIGLLLLCVTSATSLAEERVQGSLDVVLATPLPTRAIVWGKWWGAFRAVPLLAVLPTLLAAAFAPGSGRWLGVGLILISVLAFGAAVTSLGLAMATWVPRLGRALALTVTAYVLVTVGWFFIAMALSGPGPQRRFMAMAMASPFFHAGMLTALIAEPRAGPPDWEYCLACGLCWAAAFASVAAALFSATLATFNRCLGRVDETPRRPPARPVAKPSPDSLLETS